MGLKVLLLESDKGMRELILDILEGSSVEVLALDTADLVTLAEEASQFRPNIVWMGWAGLDQSALATLIGLRPFLPSSSRFFEIWVVSGADSVNLHREAAEADVVLHKRFITPDLIYALLRGAEVRFDADERDDY